MCTTAAPTTTTPTSKSSKSKGSKSLNAMIKELSIPSKDVQFREVLISSHAGDVCRGRWHGDVLIYTFPTYKAEEDLESLWQEVASLSKLRHENLQLFMGAVLEPVPCIITGMKKGPSLYEKIHVQKEPLSHAFRISVARQVAQAVGYLHAKNIVVHKRMNSHNILLENKVKLCLIDQRIASLSRSEDPLKEELSYLSPELVRSIEFRGSQLILKNEYTHESDVYAFGTILYEMSAYRFPFQRLTVESIVWRVGSGESETVHKVPCSDTLRQLMSSCWHQNPARRLSFPAIHQYLGTENVSLRRRFSSSEPEKLNFLGRTCPPPTVGINSPQSHLTHL